MYCVTTTAVQQCAARCPQSVHRLGCANGEFFVHRRHRLVARIISFLTLTWQANESAQGEGSVLSSSLCRPERCSLLLSFVYDRNDAYFRQEPDSPREYYPPLSPLVPALLCVVNLFTRQYCELRMIPCHFSLYRHDVCNFCGIVYSYLENVKQLTKRDFQFEILYVSILSIQWNQSFFKLLINFC